jgi:hypothetical protein
MLEQTVQQSSRSVAPPPIVFARHETFHPRFGWLKKGFDHAIADPSIFLREDAPVRLGVGKNMVRSIRYWESAFKLLKDDQPTEFGQQLLGDEGWDTYLEDPASLWLLHWKLLEHPCTATAWNFTFNVFHQTEFRQEDLLDQVREYCDRVAPRVVESSLRKDIGCLLRMYVQQIAKKTAKSSKSAKPAVGEESLDCPFTQLGLIHQAIDERHYIFRMGHKPTLPAEVIVYACLHHAHQTVGGGTIPIASLLYDSGSPGLIFRLTESKICEAIETMARQWEQINLSDAAGKLQFSFAGKPLNLAGDILNKYYRAAAGEQRD